MSVSLASERLGQQCWGQRGKKIDIKRIYCSLPQAAMQPSSWTSCVWHSLRADLNLLGWRPELLFLPKLSFLP